MLVLNKLFGYIIFYSTAQLLLRVDYHHFLYRLQNVYGCGVQVTASHNPAKYNGLKISGIGHCSVIVFAGTCTELVQRYMNWNEKSKGAVILKKICGVLVLLGRIYLIYRA